jgi:heme/copper-type cytochrome/quinol oxidase subunit 2
MRTFHAIFVASILATVYLALNYLLKAQYANSSVSEFLIDNIQSITWASIGFLVWSTFDFARKATHAANCKQVHGNFILWVLTFAQVCLIVLVAGETVMLAQGNQRIIAMLSGHEAIILGCVYGTSALNSMAYAAVVDVNS